MPTVCQVLSLKYFGGLTKHLGHLCAFITLTELLGLPGEHVPPILLKSGTAHPQATHLSASLPVHLSTIYLPTHSFIYSSILHHPSIHPLTHPSICPYMIDPPTHLFVHPLSTHSFVHLLTHPFVYSPITMSLCPSTFLSIHLVPTVLQLIRRPRPASSSLEV